MYAAQKPIRVISWCSVVLLAVLSLVPAQDMVRTGMPGGVEHFVAYAGSASITVAGYGRQAAVRIIGLFWIYAGVLEYLQHFSPGRHPSIADFAASGGGVSSEGLLRRYSGRSCAKRRFGGRLTYGDGRRQRETRNGCRGRTELGRPAGDSERKAEPLPCRV